MSSPASKSHRPLSPHLQVYKPQMTTIMSILHRMTGAALAVGTLMVCWWLVAAASGPVAYAVAMDFVSSPLGTFMMFGWSVALFYHMCNGIRHLFWDTARLFEMKNATRAGWLVLLCTVALTFGVWQNVLLTKPFHHYYFKKGSAHTVARQQDTPVAETIKDKKDEPKKKSKDTKPPR